MSQTENSAVATESNVKPAHRITCSKFLLVLAGHLGYLMTLAGVVFASIFILLPLTPFPKIRRRVAGAMLRGYLTFFSQRYLPAVRACRIVELTGREQLPQHGSFIFVANHRSAIDAILLLALLPPTALIIKARHSRKLGYACMVRFFDFVTMDPNALSVLRHSMNKCRALMSEGMSLLIFPEGMRTSSTTTTLMPFADLAFRMAIEHNAPIIPVVIHSDRPFLNRQKGSYFPSEIVLFRIRFLAPVSPDTERDPGRLSDIVSHKMADTLTELDRKYLQ